MTFRPIGLLGHPDGGILNDLMRYRKMMRVVSSNESSSNSALRGTVTDSRGHPAKASLLIMVTESGMEIDVNEEQSSKASYPIMVTEFGMMMDVNDEQYAKASPPIRVTEFGMVTDVNDSQPIKAPSPIMVTELGIV